MAAPTEIRVEANSITSTVVRWTYGGTDGISVYRSTDGAAYTAITTGVLPTDTSYTDTGLASGTKYWYKLSDDLGATYSSVVAVWTHGCVANRTGHDSFSLPRFSGEQQQADDLNSLAERIESALGNRVLAPAQCIACPSDGALVIDCSTGCTDWYAIADQDINSISIQWCDGAAGKITFIVPPNTTGRQIGGWPAGIGFSGDEGKKAPITTGAFGTSLSVGIGGAGGGSDSNPSSTRGYSDGTGTGTGGMAGSACTCVPDATGGLTIKSCNANNSLDCSSTKSLKLTACGGRGPYTWSRTGSVGLKSANQTTAAGATATGATITVTPPANAAPGESPSTAAYTLGIESVGCGHPHTVGNEWAQYNCADTFLSCSTVIGGTTQAFAFIDATCSCGTHSGHAVSGGLAATVSCGLVCSVACDCAKTNGNMQDRRTAGMIAAGCSPCGLNAGATVSVTDAAGVVTTVVLRA